MGAKFDSMHTKNPVLISYLILFLTLLVVGLLHLTTPFITLLFCYLILSKLSFVKRRWIAVLTFLILVAGVFYGFGFFLKQARSTLPDIVEKAIPSVVQVAAQRGIELPFDDMESLKSLAKESVNDALGYLINFAKIATKEFVFLVAGVVIAIGMFLNPELNLDRGQSPGIPNLYSFWCTEIVERFRSFYRSFERVMGAQLIISAINTMLTSIFVFASSLPYASVVIIITFLCGLLPIIGNILSNAIIVGVAFTVSAKLAGWALVFLISIHKLEYFLNSKIIGSRIRHPMWLTLLALIIGERSLGIPGIILAPVVLNFVKVEGTKTPVIVPTSEPQPDEIPPVKPF